MIKVVTVDDSAFMRKAIQSMLEKDPDIQVVGTARNGEEGLKLIAKEQPDVVTMDIEMPVMDGLSALKRVMMEMPRPVLMVSSLTTEGGESTLKAMELGAVDYIAKDLSRVSLDIVKIEKELQDKVKTIAKRKIQPPKAPRVAAKEAAACRMTLNKEKRGMQKRDIVAIGVSTGGPPAVQKLLSGLPDNYPAGILIAQHMPGAFTGPFAARLNSLCPLEVIEAKGGERLGPGKVFIAPGGKHLTIKNMASHMQVVVSDSPKEALYKPSVDVLMESVAKAGAKRSLGVILTGMGSDGKLGVRELKSGGGRAIAQSDATCVVYGMPKAIVDDGNADKIVDIDDMCEAMIDNLYM